MPYLVHHSLVLLNALRHGTWNTGATTQEVITWQVTIGTKNRLQTDLRPQGGIKSGSPAGDRPNFVSVFGVFKSVVLQVTI
jgi:hypothetical protein